MILGAVGDALGFPVEAGVAERVDGFIEWRMGKELVREGEYSDDTQLSLAVARSIWDGRFHPEYFAYVELPLWVYYQRGAGRSTMKAAMNLFSPRIQWYSNYYVGYDDAGGSGGAMRVFPIFLKVSTESVVEDTFKSVMITHGHSAAFAGAFVLLSAFRAERELSSILSSLDELTSELEEMKSVPEISKWARERKGDFWKRLEEELEKARRMLSMIDEIPSYGEYCDIVGEKKHPGMGTTTALCAVYLYLKLSAREAIFTAANERGTDTDTIASMVGNLFRESEEELEDLVEKVQDSRYIALLEKSEGKRREVDRNAVRSWAMEYEKGLKEGKLPSKHPIFGKLELLEDRGKRRMFRTEEGQSVLL